MKTKRSTKVWDIQLNRFGQIAAEQLCQAKVNKYEAWLGTDAETLRKFALPLIQSQFKGTDVDTLFKIQFPESKFVCRRTQRTWEVVDYLYFRVQNVRWNGQDLIVDTIEIVWTTEEGYFKNNLNR